MKNRTIFVKPKGFRLEGLDTGLLRRTIEAMKEVTTFDNYQTLLQMQLYASRVQKALYRAGLK